MENEKEGEVLNNSQASLLGDRDLNLTTGDQDRYECFQFTVADDEFGFQRAEFKGTMEHPR